MFTWSEQLPAIVALYEQTKNVSAYDVESVLRKKKIRLDDFPVLISQAAGKHLYELAHKAQNITRQRFGNTAQLYIPLYLSNRCVNSCAYCGFHQSARIPRNSLTVEEVRKEADYIYRQGYRNILLVSGETPEIIQEGYLEKIICVLAAKFTSVSIEIQPLEEPQYKHLVNAGMDGVTLYQETYDTGMYAQVHPAGPKKDFTHRIETMDRAGKAGVRKLGIGFLLGLSDFRKEAAALAVHCRYLLKNYWKSSVALSFPRLRECETGYQAASPVTDRELAQIIFAFRIIFPDIDLNLSTREPPALRDLLIGRGITYISAGSRTSPGGYTGDSDSGKQFELEDTRTTQEVCTALQKNGLDIVWKDWNGK